MASTGTLGDVTSRPWVPIELRAGVDHPAIDHRSTTAELAEFVDHPDVRVRAAVAVQSATTPELRARLAADPAVEVRFALASTARRHPDVVELCADDPDPWVRGRAVTFCGQDHLTLDEYMRHTRLAARNHTTATSLCNAIYADQPCGEREADRQRHSLFCVARAGVALLLRDDCDDRLANIAVHKVTEAVNHAWIFDGSGAGKGHMPIDERRELLTPLRERAAAGWRHADRVEVLFDEFCWPR